MLGGAAGIVTAGLLLRALSRWGTPGYGITAKVDVTVYVVAVILTVATGLLFGMIPARSVRQTNPLQAMKSGPLDPTPRRRLGPRDLLLGAQIVICTVLVIASLVAVRGMVRLLRTPLGFQPEGALVAEMDLSEVEGDVPLEKIKAMIEARAKHPRGDDGGASQQIAIYRRDPRYSCFPAGDDRAFSEQFRAFAIPVHHISRLSRDGTDPAPRGRDVSWRDTTNTPYVAIVNETFARKMWGDSPALGQRFIFLDHLREVVGVVEDGKYHNMQESPEPVVYLPLAQNEQGHNRFRPAVKSGATTRWRRRSNGP